MSTARTSSSAKASASSRDPAAETYRRVMTVGAAVVLGTTVITRSAPDRPSIANDEAGGRTTMSEREPQVIQALREELVAVSRRGHQQGLVPGVSGNNSVHRDHR